MKFKLHQTPLDPPMKAIIIYDNFAFAAKATELLQRVAQQADTAMHWNLKLWRLDTLSLPHRADEALAEALDAHLIVFAGHRTQLLPSWLLNCLERWAACRQVADASLAVVGGRSGNDLIVPKAPELLSFANQNGFSFITSDDLAIKCETDFAARNPAEVSMPLATDLVAFYGCTTGNFYRGEVQNYVNQK
jgi:hypothetical protein